MAQYSSLVLSLILCLVGIALGPGSVVVLVQSRSVPAEDDVTGSDVEDDPGLDDLWLAGFDGGNAEKYVVRGSAIFFFLSMICV